MLPRIMNRAQELTIKNLWFCGGHAFRLHGYSSTYKSGAQAATFAIGALKAMRGEQ
jgi:hypothetical protein